jgi:hypothetical protein
VHTPRAPNAMHAQLDALTVSSTITPNHQSAIHAISASTTTQALDSVRLRGAQRARIATRRTPRSLPRITIVQTTLAAVSNC